ncbi:MAG: hypothetical protein AB1423_00805 [Pseudomonadota bacterium]
MELKVIPFDYCSLARAAKFFDCEVEDFFHWYDTGKISLSLNLCDHQATLLSVNDQCIEFKSPFNGSDHIAYDQFASASNNYSCITDSSIFIGHTLSYDHLGKVYRVGGVAHDFWKPCDAFIQTLKNGGRICESFSASPHDFTKPFRIMVKVSEDYQFSAPDSPVMSFHPEFKISDLVLRKEELNIINHLMCGLEVPESSASISAPTVDDVMDSQEQLLDWADFNSKDTSLKFIAGMVLALQKASPKFRNGEKINRSAIAKEAVSHIVKQGIEFDITDRQLTNLINKALELHAPKAGETD